jgi:D-3-phosphoglycerate dehydrogenase / 2-oxoglutarate reductase
MIAAIICGRADGQKFLGRNTVPIFGRPLMVYATLAALNASEVNRVFLTSDDAGMKRIARHHGVETIDRPAGLTGDSVSLELVVKHAYSEVRRAMGADLEAVVVLLANAPTVTSAQIDQGVRNLRADPTLDAVIAVSTHDEFHPSYALQLTEQGRLRHHAAARLGDHPGQIYFPDALLWVVRPGAIGEGADTGSGWLVDIDGGRVAGLVHEGYGDVDYAWQIPLVEDWLRRRGFDEAKTPYDAIPAGVTRPPGSLTAISPARTGAERRVLITTVPFGVQRRPLDLLEADGVEYVINPIGRRLKEEELADMIGGYGVVIAGTEPITARVMDAAPHLRLISRVGIGLDSVDLAAARARGVAVSYTPEAPSPAVAELAVGLMLSLLRDIPGADRVMRDGVWRRTMGRRLSNMTVGVVGVGRIGKRVIRHLSGGFPGVKILANDILPDLGFGARYEIEWADKDTVYRSADIVSLHLPLTSQTRALITAREIGLMKPQALLVNTSRGNMINEQDLAAALGAGRIGGAAIDVFEREPYSGELTTFERCILTCHMGSMSEDCRARMELEATEEAIRFLRGEPLLNPVPESEYALAH